jgi:hypothetical protein
MTEQTYTSAVKRLANIPEIFTGNDLATIFGWTSAICSNYLAVWRKAGLIKSLGGRTDVHMNLLRNGRVNTEAALRRVYPRAIKVGVDILREAGWTTQIPKMIDVAIPRTNTIYKLSDINLSKRSDKWFATVAIGTERVSQGIDRLKPHWALADMIHRAQDKRVHGAWLLAPDDIDLDAVRENITAMNAMKAIKAFGLSEECFDDAAYAALYDG